MVLVCLCMSSFFLLILSYVHCVCSIQVIIHEYTAMASSTTMSNLRVECYCNQWCPVQGFSPTSNNVSAILTNRATIWVVNIKIQGLCVDKQSQNKICSQNAIGHLFVQPTLAFTQPLANLASDWGITTYVADSKQSC